VRRQDRGNLRYQSPAPRRIEVSEGVVTTERVTYALLVFATAVMGFGGRPWVAFTVGVAFILVLAILEHFEILERHRGEPVTDIVLAMMVKVSLSILAAFAIAWFGYGLRLLLH
jgi:4-hydroxybenzoate polyprenyltransferase